MLDEVLKENDYNHNFNGELVKGEGVKKPVIFNPSKKFSMW